MIQKYINHKRYKTASIKRGERVTLGCDQILAFDI